MKRPFLSLTAGFVLFATVIAEAAVNPLEGVMPPYEKTSPYAPEDLRKVIYFFSYACPFCAQYDVYFFSWGNGFPENLALDPVPVVARESDIPLARAFYAAKLTDPERIAFFNQQVFMALQYQGKKPNAYETYEEAAIKAEISPNDFRKNWNDKENMQLVMEARQRLVHYRPTATPTLVINGKFMTNADKVRGDYELLFKLASGLVSRYIDNTQDKDWFAESMGEIEKEKGNGSNVPQTYPIR